MAKSKTSVIRIGAGVREYLFENRENPWFKKPVYRLVRKWIFTK